MSKMLPPAVLLERNKTDLLSKVQSKGRSSASLRVRRRGVDSRGPLAKNSATYTSSCALHLLKTSLLPSVVALGRIIIFATGNLHGSAGRTAIAGVHDYVPKVGRILSRSAGFVCIRQILSVGRNCRCG